ncbi:MAG: hypothetical protein HYZ18_00735 [Pseudogulbenkiania sp.]|nr:hypothetical protein [Pseudogulbenkiania sp.]
MKKLLKKLERRLTPETNRQPVITGQSWQIHWQQDLASDDVECIGILLQIDKRLFWRVPEGDELLFWPGPDRQILGNLLDALTFRFAAGDATPPLGIRLTHPRESAGDTINEILTYLWRHGPALTLRKKKARYPDDGETRLDSHGQESQEETPTRYHAVGAPEPQPHGAAQAPEKHNG